MAQQDAEELNPLDPVFAEHRDRLLALALRNLNPILLRRLSSDRILHELRRVCLR